MTDFFRGRFECRIDSKGRLALPVGYRSAGVYSSGQQYIITNSYVQGRPCLDLYTLMEWQKLEQRIATLPQLSPEVQSFQRFYLAGGQLLEIDSHLRLLIPATLRRFAFLEAELVLVGMGQKIEIWAHHHWKALFSGLLNNFDAILGTIGQLEVRG